MAYEELKQNLADVAFTTAVPFVEGGAIRHDALRENLKYAYDAGARLFIPCGNTGEYYALDDEERIAVVETHVEALNDDATIVAGAGGSLGEIETLVDGYEDAGVDALLLMHPVHTYIHEEGLAAYYHEIADMTDLGLVIYKRGPDVSREVIADVSTRENIVGVKFATDDIKEFSQTVGDTPGDLAWINGIAERYALAFAIEGADGYTTGIGNFVPEATLALFEAIAGEDWSEAERIRDLLRPLEDLREETGRDNAIAAANNVPAVKHGMDLAGLEGGSVRPPLAELDPEDASRLEEYYRQVQDASF